MPEDWGGYIVAALSVCTACIAIAEFYGGKELQAWIKAKLEDWWLRLSYVQGPNVGRAEAEFSSRILNKVLGRTWSLRRVLVSVGLAAVFVVAGLMRVFRRFDEVGNTLAGAWGQWLLTVEALAIVTFASLALTHLILTRSITWWSNHRFSSAYFLLTLIGTLLLTAGFLNLMRNALVAGIRWSFSLGPENYMLSSAMVSFGLIVYAMEYFLLWFRVVLFAAFILWIAAGWMLLLVRLTIYRLFEAEKGALTVCSAMLTAAAAGLKWWSEFVSPPLLPL